MDSVRSVLWFKHSNSIYSRTAVIFGTLLRKPEASNTGYLDPLGRLLGGSPKSPNCRFCVNTLRHTVGILCISYGQYYWLTKRT